MFLLFENVIFVVFEAVVLAVEEYKNSLLDRSERY